MTTRLLYPFSLFLLFCLLITSSSPAEPPKPIGPRIKIEPQSIDFGTIDTNDPVTKTVRITNTGDQPLDAEEDCCGTVFNQWRRNIAPGESVDFPITIALRKQAAGPYKSSRTIRSNDPEQLHSRIEVLALYRPLVYLDPPVIHFGVVPPGKESEALATIYSRDKDVQIKAIESGHPNFTAATIDPEMLRAADPEYPGRKVIEFYRPVGLPSGAIAGNAKFVILARHPDHPNDPPQQIELTASIIAHIQGDLLAEPRFIRVAQAFPGEPFTEKILISSSTGRAFTITSCIIIESTLPNVSARTEPINDPNLKSHFLILEGTGADTLGMFRGYVELTTDIPNESPLRIQFNGFTREKPKPAPPN